MSDFKKRAGVAVACLVAAAFAALGSAAAKETALTHDSVVRFLESFSEMRVLAMSEGVRTGAEAESSKNPIGIIVKAIKAIKASKLQGKAQDIAVKHGFANLKDWSDTGRAIGQAYLYVKGGAAVGIARAALDKNKDTALSELEKLGLLNAKQKERLKDHLDDLGEQLSHEPPPQNVAVVEPMTADIEAAVKLGLN